MTDQEKFEAWYGEHYTTFLPRDFAGEYANADTLLAWKTWQESRRQLEEEVLRHKYRLAAARREIREAKSRRGRVKKALAELVEAVEDGSVSVHARLKQAKEVLE